MKEEIIQEIRSKADIVEVIQRYLPLTKKGKNYAAVCPFHDDHDPSMSISVDKQIYKCFVCGAGGNVFNFVKEYEKISFSEAVIRVAHGINYTIDDSFLPKKINIDPKIKSYYDVLHEYIRYTHYVLAGEEGSQALAYLNQRGLDAHLIDQFEMGYNPADDKATTFLQAKGYSAEVCTKTNITRLNEYGMKDVFEQRIVFPIHDAEGNPVGFTARTLNSKEPSKYINTTETPLYVKGKILYNYHRAIKSIKQQKAVILVEGVMDAFAYAKVGIEHVVASLGTACTKDQIRLLQNATPLVILSYDGDEAGQAATIKVGHLLLQHRLKVEVIQNTTGLDPDEIIQQHSKERLVEMVKRRVSFPEFFFEYSLKKLDIENYSQKKEFAKLMMVEIQTLPDPFDRNHLLERLVQVTQFSQEQLSLLVPQEFKQFIPKAVVKRTQKNELDAWAEKEICGQMLVSQQAMHEFRKELGYFVDPLFQKLALSIMNYYRSHDTIIIADFLNGIEDKSLQELITQIVESDIYYNNYSQNALWDALKQVKIDTIDTQIAQFKQEHKDQLEYQQDPEALKSLQSLLNLRRDLKQRKEDSDGKQR